MKIDTDPNLPPVASKPYPLPLKCHKFVKEEIENLLKAGLIQRSMSLYATPIIVVLRKGKPGTPLSETKRSVIDYHKSNEQIPKVQSTQAKYKGSLTLTETAKIDHIWSKLKWEGTIWLLFCKGPVLWHNYQYMINPPIHD